MLALNLTLEQLDILYTRRHSRRHDELVQLYAFDILVLDGEDLHGLTLSVRKTHLTRLLARWPDGIVAPFEQGEIGPDLFRAACSWGLEGLVSKLADRPYRAGPAKGQGQDQEPQASGLPAGTGSDLEGARRAVEPNSALVQWRMKAVPAAATLV